MSPLIESIVLFYAQKRQISWVWNMMFAPTWLRQVTSPPASHDHFNHCEGQNLFLSKNRERPSIGLVVN